MTSHDIPLLPQDSRNSDLRPNWADLTTVDSGADGAGLRIRLRKEPS